MYLTFKDEDSEPMLLHQEDMDSLETFFQLPSPSLRTICFDSLAVILGKIYTVQEFIIDLAQMKVVISGPLRSPETVVSSARCQRLSQWRRCGPNLRRLRRYGQI